MMPDPSGGAQMVVVHYHEISLKRGNRPLFLRRLSIDPALAGGVVLTTVTDVVGIFAFVGLASFVLLTN
jgi:magnesium transporter